MSQAIARLLPRKTSQDGAIDPRMRHMVENVLMNSPVTRGLGIRLEVIEPEHVELVLPFLTTNVTHGSIVHGGVIATLIDIAGAAAAASGANGDEVRGGATSSLTVQYLAHRPRPRPCAPWQPWSAAAGGRWSAILRSTRKHRMRACSWPRR